MGVGGIHDWLTEVVQVVGHSFFAAVCCFLLVTCSPRPTLDPNVATKKKIPKPTLAPTPIRNSQHEGPDPKPSYSLLIYRFLPHKS